MLIGNKLLQLAFANCGVTQAAVQSNTIVVKVKVLEDKKRRQE